MKQTLSLKLGQQLTMTPQLQQAIRLLQLSSLDLQQEIHLQYQFGQRLTKKMMELLQFLVFKDAILHHFKFG